MKKIITILLVIGLTSCGKNDLRTEFNCNSTKNFGDTKEYRDILKKFKISLPRNWKTQLYYDEFKSQLYSADTTKQLTQTYIFDVAWHQGQLDFNDAFKKRVSDTLKIKEQLSTVKSEFGKFKERPMYYNLSQGKRSGRLYTFMQVYIKTNLDEYFLMSTKVYGDSAIDSRLCESIQLFDKVKFIE